MNRNIRSVGLGLIIAASLASRGDAQGRIKTATAEEMRDLIIEDSLTPAKSQLRDYVAQLRDTLISVPALRASISRNRATGVTSVVLSNGRELGKRCRVSEAMAVMTIERVAAMKTSDPRGDQALNGYRSGLATLTEDMKTCVRDDSLTMVAASPDQGRIEQIAAAASDAVMRYDSIRDALMRLLNITLPIKGTIRPHGK